MAADDSINPVPGTDFAPIATDPQHTESKTRIFTRDDGVTPTSTEAMNAYPRFLQRKRERCYQPKSGRVAVVIINNNSVRTQPVVTTTANKPPVSASAVADNSDADQTLSGNSVSVLARQLSAAAERALVRDAALEPSALGQKASQVLYELLSRTPQSDPASDAAKVLEADALGRNPFQGMPRDQLALITYDEGGDFSVKERISAWQEAVTQEHLWRQSATQRALDEHSTTDNLGGFFNEALTHFKSLPSIEQAQYGSDYATGLQSKINVDFKLKSPQMGEQDSSLLDVIQGSFPELASGQLSGSKDSATVKFSSPSDVSIGNNSCTDDRGRQLMLTRLYGGRAPAVVDGKHGMSLDNISRGSYEFLTLQDRELLSDIYAYAQDQGVDLTYVDLIAGDIGDYRQVDNGRLMSSFNDGYCYDAQGWQVTVGFTEQDAATASRILNGAAINSTRFDQGLLRFMLDPGFGALSNSADLAFVEQVVTHFSAEAANAMPMDSRFSTYVHVGFADKSIMTASTEIRLPRSEPNSASQHEESLMTANALHSGFNPEAVAAKPVRSLMELISVEAGLDIVRERDDAEKGWLGRFWKQFQDR